MKKFNILLISIIFLGCAKEKLMTPNVIKEFDRNIDIGSFSILQESLSTIPYKHDSTVVFVDSMGTEMAFKIISQNLIIIDSVELYKYNVNTEGDTVTYLYSTQFKYSDIINEENDIRFRTSLKSHPLNSNPESRKVADIYEIDCIAPNQINFGSRVFYEIINQRTWPVGTNTKVLEDVEIFGRTFENVKMNQFTDPKSVVLFNYELGIVSFTDTNNEIWRFDRFE